MEYTRLTNLDVLGSLKAGEIKIGEDADDYTVTKADATAAAGTEPTKAEFDAVVELVNQLKSMHNDLVDAIM